MSEIKRLNYFIGQFLTADDFLDEQAYHLAQRRRNNRLRYGPGILDGGFLVTPGLTVDSIEVGAGTAIDREGQEIVLLDPVTLNIAAASAGDHYLVVYYKEEQDDADKRKDGVYEGAIRITERTKIELRDVLPSSDKVGLELAIARISVTVDAAGQRQVAIRNDDALGQPLRQPSRLQYSNEGGNKLVVYDTGPTDRYGFGLNSGNLNAFVPTGGRFSLRQNGYDGTEVFSVAGTGECALLSGALSVDKSWLPNPVFAGTTFTTKANLKLDGDSSLCLHAQNGLAALVVDGPIMSTESGAYFAGNVGIGTTTPKSALQVVGAAVVNDGLGVGSAAANNSNMAAGSLTIGSTERSFGGGTGWNSDTAGLLLETKDNTEIAVHDAGKRLASLAYYEGTQTDGSDRNRITIGRDMGWGTISEVALMGQVRVKGDLTVDGELYLANGHTWISGYVDFYLAAVAPNVVVRSPWIDSSLGPGPLQVQVAMAADDGTIIGMDATAKFKVSAQVDPASGKIRIDAARTDTSVNSVRIRWWAASTQDLGLSASAGLRLAFVEPKWDAGFDGYSISTVRLIVAMDPNVDLAWSVLMGRGRVEVETSTTAVFYLPPDRNDDEYFTVVASSVDENFPGSASVRFWFTNLGD